MRGLDEIHETNENPHHRRDEQFGARAHPGDPSNANRSFESNMADKRKREAEGYPSKTNAILEDILSDIVGGRAKIAGDKTGDYIADLLKTGNEKQATDELISLLAFAAVVDAASHSRPRRDPLHRFRGMDGVRPDPFLGMEGVHSAIDATPPFFNFWNKLNAERAARGEIEAGYKEAKIAFEGGATPLGAITFIGKRWDGLRAVPSKPVKELGGLRPHYHAEYREVTDHGTIWHKVNALDRGRTRWCDREVPIAYACPEAALVAAEETRQLKVALAFR